MKRGRKAWWDVENNGEMWERERDEREEWQMQVKNGKRERGIESWVCLRAMSDVTDL